MYFNIYIYTYIYNIYNIKVQEISVKQNNNENYKNKNKNHKVVISRDFGDQCLPNMSHNHKISNKWQFRIYICCLSWGGQEKKIIPTDHVIIKCIWFQLQSDNKKES